MKSAPKTVPFPKADPFASDVDELAARMGGRAALMRYLSPSLTADTGTEPPNDLDGEGEGSGRKTRGFDVLLRLDADDLARLEQQSRAMNCTRNKWVAALLSKALHGKAPLNAAERGGIVTVIKELRKIEAGAAQGNRVN